MFAAKMRHTMRSEDLTPERILAAAEREHAAVRAEMVRLAGELWPTWCPDEERPAEDGALVRGVLDAIAAQHREADELLDFSREETARIEAFCREHDVIGLDRRAARHPLDTGVPAGVRRGDAHLAGGARADPDRLLRDHADARRLDRRAARVVPARGQRPDAPAAGHPRGGPRALPPGRLREPQRLAAARHLLERPVRRGVGGVRDPGDDGPGLRVGRPGAPPDALEVLPALDHERDRRCADPLPRHDRGRGRDPDGRRRASRRSPRRARSTAGRGCRRRSSRPISRARWRCGTSSSRPDGARRRRSGPTPTRSGRAGCRAVSGRRPASSTASTSSR